MQKLVRRLFKPRYLLWLANLALILPWLAIGVLVLLGRLNQQPDPMPALMILLMVMSILTFILGIVAVVLGLGMGIVAIVWAIRTQRLKQMIWEVAVWSCLLASWVWFGFVL